jgi:hypothetical protein
MSVAQNELKFYGSANMQDTDSGTQGGAISTAKKIEFKDISPSGNIQIVSSSASDTTQTVTAYGKDASGVAINEGKTLNGQTPVAMTAQTTWERLLKAIKSATCAGDVAVEAVTAEVSNTAQAGAADSITLHSGASGTDNYYRGMVIRLTGGQGSGQIRQIIDYNGTTKIAKVNYNFSTLPNATTTFRICEGMVFDKSPAEITEVRVPFYDAAAPASGTTDYYEKIFCKNTNGTTSLTSAVIKEASDPSGKIGFGLAATLDDTASVANRLTAPGGISFDSADKNVANSQNLTPGSAQGIWLKLSLASTDVATKTTYTPRVQGNTI